MATSTAVSYPIDNSLCFTSLSIVFGIPIKLIFPFAVSVCKIFKLPSPPIPMRASNPSFLKFDIIRSEVSIFFPSFSVTPNGLPLF